jgi:hypothetical protein
MQDCETIERNTPHLAAPPASHQDRDRVLQAGCKPSPPRASVDDDTWLDKNCLRRLIAKSNRPTGDCSYRIVLSTQFVTRL